MKAWRLIIAVSAGGALVSASAAHALDFPPPEDAPPSAWIVDLGGYGVLQPIWLGSKHYELGFRPIADIRQADDRQFLSFPNDAITYSLLETDSFRAGPAVSISLQSRLHGQDIDLRLAKADVTTQGGGFIEYYPLESIRTRAEVLQGVTGNSGLAVNFSADYIWRPRPDWTLTFGPRAQFANDQYASEYFSTQYAFAHNNLYSPFRVEGGLLSSGAELMGKYDWTSRVSTKFFLDYNQLVGDAAESARVATRGAAEQVTFGIGATYQFTVHP